MSNNNLNLRVSLLTGHNCLSTQENFFTVCICSVIFFFFNLNNFVGFQDCMSQSIKCRIISVKFDLQPRLLPHKKNSVEIFIGVLVCSEWLYPGVCFIMVLGLLRADLWHPGENLLSALIYQSPAGGRQKDTLRPLLFRPSLPHHIQN